MSPIRFCLVARDQDSLIVERYFLRSEHKVRRISGQLLIQVRIHSVEVIKLCEHCGEETARCTCTPRHIAASQTLQTEAVIHA